MPLIINVANVKTNSITNNGNIEFGSAVQNSHTANNKFVGASFTFGDFSLNVSFDLNNVFDSDISDQDQILNPSIPISNQF